MRPDVCAWRPSTSHVCASARVFLSSSLEIPKGIDSGSDPNRVPNQTRKVPRWADGWVRTNQETGEGKGGDSGDRSCKTRRGMGRKEPILCGGWKG